ncbi:MAG: NIPSNAP family protein [Chthoniobacterales bacterium]
MHLHLLEVHARVFASCARQVSARRDPLDRLIATSTANANLSAVIYHCIRYTIDPQKLADFEAYSRRWMEGGIIKRCGGEPLGYFLPKKGYGGADNIAMALIGFENLTAYEAYREKLIADPEAKENLEFAKKAGFILVEDRSYFYRV